jgi:hypothetical protein
MINNNYLMPANLLKNKTDSYFILSNLLKITLMESKAFYYKILFSKNLFRPWMKYKEIFIIEELLKFLCPQNCLEWGTGYSTLYFPKYLKDVSWLAIEHDPDWANNIKALNEHENVKIIHVPPNQYPWTDSNNDGSYQDLINYIETPSNYGGYDFILIDGRARKECLIRSSTMLNNNAIVVLHDANRIYYTEPFAMYKYSLLLRDHNVNRGGLWIGSNGINLPVICNNLMKIWDLYSKPSNLKKTIKSLINFING